MEYRRLGNTGLRVSELCMGTMTFGSNFFGIGALGQEAARELVARALESGVNFFDTANVYSYGESEEILGSAVKSLGAARESLVIATKVRGAMSEGAIAGTGDVNNVGLSRKHIMESCEASLRRLGTDYVDLYQVHGWDALTPIEETLRALDDLVRQGKVRYLGCSNWTARHLSKALAVSEGRGWERFVSLQAYYSLVGRDLEHELLPLCVEEGLGVLPWSPLSGGFLSGKYRREDPSPEGARRTNFQFPLIDEARGFDAVDALEEVARSRGASVAQAALAWLLARPAVSSVIIGANKMSQLEDNLKAVGLKLSAEEIERLSATTAPPRMYPQWMVEFQGAGRATQSEVTPAQSSSSSAAAGSDA
ncbi:MAG TPA: aldo/keto reductase [Pyrinomonadaceae bacterium]|nr:aldo/keto reductase [Pyrinomonadaceae bacterium]